jgi:hypothetical protein
MTIKNNKTQSQKDNATSSKEDIYQGQYFSVVPSKDYFRNEGWVNGYSIHFQHNLGINTTFRRTLKGGISYGARKTKNIHNIRNVNLLNTNFN